MEKLVARVMTHYNVQGFMTDVQIRQFIEDSNSSINRYYEASELDIKLFREQNDHNKDGEICEGDLRRSFSKYLQ